LASNLGWSHQSRTEGWPFVLVLATNED
jgi:hypothetical protein